MVKGSNEQDTRKPAGRKVMIAGTFDIIHPGHVHLIEEAMKIGRVYVVVGTDAVVTRLKGKAPVVPQDQRVYMVSRIKGIEEARLGYESLDFSHIIADVVPDVILLGPDQGPSEEKLKDMIEKIHLSIEIKRLPRRVNPFPLCSTSEIVERIKKNRCP